MVTPPTLHSDNFCSSLTISDTPLPSKRACRQPPFPMSNSTSQSSARNRNATRRKIRIFPHLLPPASLTAPALLPPSAAPPSAPLRAVHRAKVREGVLPCWLAGWLASGAVQKDGQRRRVRLRSETDRDRGEGGCRTLTHTHTRVRTAERTLRVHGPDDGRRRTHRMGKERLLGRSPAAPQPAAQNLKFLGDASGF